MRHGRRPDSRDSAPQDARRTGDGISAAGWMRSASAMARARRAACHHARGWSHLDRAVVNIQSQAGNPTQGLGAPWSQAYDGGRQWSGAPAGTRRWDRVALAFVMRQDGEEARWPSLCLCLSLYLTYADMLVWSARARHKHPVGHLSAARPRGFVEAPRTWTIAHMRARDTHHSCARRCAVPKKAVAVVTTATRTLHDADVKRYAVASRTTGT